MSNPSLSVLDRAIIFATQAHTGMVRKKTTTPYILHPLEAAAIVGSMTDKEEVIAAAVLHDVLEDTTSSVEALLDEFGGRITELVRAESEDKQKDKPAADTWKPRKQATIDHLNSINDPELMMITLGDKLSNIRAIQRDYMAIGDELWDRFNMKDKSQHGWYYRAVADAIRELSKFPAWQEYDRLVREVFE